MKKFFALILIISFCGIANAATVSNDMSDYVRKDVFEAYMQNINSNTEKILEELRAQRKEFTEELKAQRKEFTDELKAQRKEFTEGLAAQQKEFMEEFKSQRKSINELTTSVSVLTERVNGLDKRVNGLENRVNGLENSMNENFKNVNTQIQVIESRANNSYNNIEAHISNNYRNLDSRIGDLRNDIYLWLVIIGIVIGSIPAKKFVQWLQERKFIRNNSITIEDIEKIATQVATRVSENLINAKLAGK